MLDWLVLGAIYRSRIIHTWQDAPYSVNLGVVLVDLGDEEEHRREGKRNCKGHNQRIRGDVEEFQVVETGGMLEEFDRHII